MRSFFIAAIVMALCSCASPQVITANPSGGSSTPLLPQAIKAGSDQATDLADAEYNLDQAIAIGVLPKTDPADSCAHAWMQDAGLENPDGTPATSAPTVTANSFTAKVAQPISVSAGSVLYIRLQQAKQVSLSQVQLT